MATLAITLDDSAFSRSVFPHVKKMFEPDRWKVVLLHVAPVPAPVNVQERTVQERTPFREGRTGMLGSELGYGSTAPTTADLGNRIDDMRQRLEWEFDDDAKGLRAVGFDSSVEVRFGRDPALEIASYASEGSTDVLVMATHRRSAAGRLFRGSVAERVLHLVDVPVLLIRTNEHSAEAEAEVQQVPDDAERPWLEGSPEQPRPTGRPRRSMP